MAKDRVVSTFGSVLDMERGERFSFYPGMKESDIPESCLRLMTNPKVWEAPMDIGLSNVPYDSSPVDYQSLNVPALMDLMRARGLEAPSMKKQELITALVANDDGPA